MKALFFDFDDPKLNYIGKLLEERFVMGNKSIGDIEIKLPGLIVFFVIAYAWVGFLGWWAVHYK